MLDAIPAGPEFRANAFVTGRQQDPAVAVDADGDFVVVWESIGQDGDGSGIFAQRYNAVGVAQGAEFRVNQHTNSDQEDPAVAIDADGDFVIAWQSVNQEGGPTALSGVYARRYDAAGVPQGGEFLVNTYTTNIQEDPAVAMDPSGNFVVAWGTIGFDGSNSAVHAQRYDATGARAGGEFPVNQYTTAFQGLPSVAMDGDGDVVIAWQSTGQDGSYGGIYARRFNATGAAQGNEFRVNSHTLSDQENPVVATAPGGAVVVAWKSLNQDGSGDGVYAQRFSAAGAPLGGEFRVNTFTTDVQAFPSVAFSSSGDFVIAWESYGQDGSDASVHVQRYGAGGAPVGAAARVNAYTTGSQDRPAVATSAKGDFVVAWRSIDQDTSDAGVYAQRFAESIDAAPPVVAGAWVHGLRVLPYSTSRPNLTRIVVSFSEDVSDLGGPFGANSVTNIHNWVVTSNDPNLSGEVLSSVTYGFNATTRRFEATVDMAVTYEFGNFILMATDDIRDAAGNALDGDFDGAPGGNFILPFAVGVGPAGAETRANTFTSNRQGLPAIAADDAGNYVVTWQSFGQDGSADGIYARRYSAAGAALGGEFRVNETITGAQAAPSIARDADGDFVIAWHSDAQDGSLHGVYARRYNASGFAQGSEFRVNTHTLDNQTFPAVAMDNDGDFVIAWNSFNQDGSGTGVYAQRFAAGGLPLGGEFRVNQVTTSTQAYPALAADADGDFVVTWQSYGQDAPLNFGVYARRYNAAGAAQGNEFRVNQHTTNAQTAPSVGTDPAGNFVVGWTSTGQDGSGDGVYARRFSSAGAALAGEFRVNTFTTDNQHSASVDVGPGGEFVVAWTGRNQDGSFDGVYAQQYDASGVELDNDRRVNTYTTGVQTFAAVAVDADGDFVVAWEGDAQDGSQGGVFAQRFALERTPTVGSLEDSPDTIEPGEQLTLFAGDVTDNNAVSAVSFYRETNGIPGLQHGFFSDTFVATDSSGGNGWSVNVPTAALPGGTHTYYAQAIDNAGLIGAPASTTNVVIVDPAPVVTASDFLFQTAPQRITFTFDQNVAASLTLADVVIRALPNGPTVTPASLTYDAATNRATVTLGGILADGNYRATLLAAGVTGPSGVPLTADHTYDFFFLRGDANRDGRVTLGDFNLLAGNFGQGPRTFAQGDFNYDTVVNLADFNILASRFGMSLSPPASGTSIAGPVHAPPGPSSRLVDTLREDLLA